MADNKGGRPSSYSQELADSICEQLADGMSLRDICKADDMPSKGTVFRWLAQNQAFQDQYAHARDAQADVLADEILSIADDGTNDWQEKYGKDGEQTGWQVNGEAVQRSRLRVDSRKWIASKLKPKKYGDKIEQEIKGEIGLTVNIVRFGDEAKE